MKRLFLYLTILYSISFFAQPTNLRVKKITISQKLLNKKGKQLILKRIISDSRCPEGMNCIWAGDCEIELGIYQNRKLISTQNIQLSSRKHDENVSWFKEFYCNQTIFEISLFPYPKSEANYKPKDFYVVIMYK